MSSPSIRSTRAASEKTQKRLALLVRAGELFHQSLDLEETLSNVARMAVESFADLCLFDLLDESSGKLYVSVGAHRDPEIESSLKALVTPLLQGESRGIHPARRVAQSGRSYFVPTFDERTIMEHAASDEHEHFIRTMGYRSKIVVPVAAQSEIFGALTFVRTVEGEPFDPEDVQAAEELGRRAGLAVANAKQYLREQHVADTLQRAFLSDEPPRCETLRFHALYRGAQDGSALGGDWYDVFETGDSIVVTVGDVTGKGLDAARLMVQIRQWVRLASVVSRDPGEMMRLLNRAMLLERKNSLATAFIGVLDTKRNALFYVSAGHPPPFLKRGLRGSALLPGSDVPLGATDEPEYATRRVALDGATLLVLYTDGLTEIDRTPLDGEAAVAALIDDDMVLHAANAARFLERATAGKHVRDDMAILTVRFGMSSGEWRFDVGDSGAAYAIKREFLHAIAETAVDLDVAACELIFGELIGNAVRYAPGPLSLSLSLESGGVLLHVMDEGPGFERPPALPSDVWSESGRGLFLVAALSEDVMIRRLPGYGTYVKVRLPRAAARPAQQGSARGRATAAVG
ncbi:MAG TPA: SpoIIE family protein phosphatase [Candidatus Baltobacteraceae bacterium]|nr:SpoIIE family protein phosphatase [Candidatus Baltobacteraceae bacterium]